MRLCACVLCVLTLAWLQTSQDWVCFDSQFRAEACNLKILHDRSTMPDTKTSGAMLHATYDASCNYDELLLFVNTDTVSERLIPRTALGRLSTDETPGCLSKSGS